MGLWKRIGRSGKAAALLAAGIAGGAAAFAVASVPGPDGVIHACYEVSATNGTTAPVTAGPNLRIVDPSANQTCNTVAGARVPEQALDWNQQGPPGQQGQQGPQGPAVTIAAGHTFTISGGQVITVGNGNGVTVVSPSINLGHSVGQVLLGSGGQALGFNIAGLNFATGQHGGGGGAGKVAVHDISITKRIDKASPKLALYCASGKHFPKVTITMRKAGKVYLTYTLKDVIISSYQTGGSSHADQPTESLSLNFTKVEYKYAK